MKLVSQRGVLLHYLILSIVLLGFLFLLPALGAGAVSIKWSLTVFIFCALLLAFQIISIRWFIPRQRLIFILFIILSYLFNISQVFLYGIGYELSENVGWASILKSNDVQDATIIAIKSIICFFWGGVTFFVFFNNSNSKKNFLETPGKLFVTVLLVVGFLCDVITNIYYPIAYGYAEGESSLLRTMLRLFGFLFSSAIVLKLSDCSIPKERRKMILLFFIGYKLICMMTGYRAFSLINIAMAVYVYVRVTGGLKLTFKAVVLTIGAIVIGSALLVTVRNTRQTGVDLSSMAGIGVSGNPIFDIIAEFGITLNVIIAALRDMNGIGVGGGQLFTSFLSIIPGASSLFPNVDFYGLTMDTALDIRGIGGSYIGDLVFDFGANGISVSSFILGIILTPLFESFERAIDQKRYVYMAFMFPMMVSFIYCVRSSLAKMPREFVWFFIIFYILWLFFAKRKRGQLAF